jgi:hypothetical protein
LTLASCSQKTVDDLAIVAAGIDILELAKSSFG